MDLRLLIVDDNRHFLSAARGLLEREGMAVVGVASTSAEALQRATDLTPDVALVDVVLGDESGLELAERFAREGGHLPRIVLISTYAEEDVFDLLEDSPAVGFVAKSKLSARAIREVLGEG